MAKTDKIRHGLEHWRTKASERGGEALVAQLDSMVTLLRECKHDGPQHATGDHTACFECKWVRHTPTGEWEPVGLGR